MCPLGFKLSSTFTCYFLAVLPQPAPSVLARDDRPAAPAYKQLTGADLRRVEELDQTIEQLERAGKFADAIAPTKEVLAIRERAIGPDHWETTDVRIHVEFLERVSGLPDEGRKAMASVAAL